MSSKPVQLSLFDAPPAAEPMKPSAKVTTVPSIPPEPDAALSAAIAAYIEHLPEVKMADATQYAMTNDMNVLGDILGMNRPVNSLTRSDLERVVRALENTSKPATVARRLHTLNAFLDWLRERGALRSSLHLDVERPEPDRIIILTFDDVSRLVLAVNHEPRTNFMVQLVLGTGLKRNEIAALQHQHVRLDPDNPRIVVESKIDYKARTVTAPDTLRLAYDTYCLSLSDQPPVPEARVFGVTARALEYDLARYADSLHLPCNFAALRWTAAVRFLQQGIDPDRLRRKLGLAEQGWDETLGRLQQLR